MNTATTAAPAAPARLSQPAIALSAPVNLRDLGGIRGPLGPVREGFAIRTDDLAYVTDAVADRLVDGGLAAIIDLRSPAEVALTGRGPLAAFPVAYHHLPLMSDIAAGVDPAQPILTHERMGAMYVGMVNRAAGQLVTALNVIAFAPGATAFHCSAGRDRTGVLAAMLLLALEVDEDAIVADYALTGENMPAIQDRTAGVIGPLMRDLGFDFEKLGSRSMLEDGPMDVSMRILLDGLRAEHGHPLAPLRAAGLSDATVGRLRERAFGA